MKETIYILPLVYLLAACGEAPENAFNPVDASQSFPDTSETSEQTQELETPYPVVLVHGFSGWSQAQGFTYFSGVKETLKFAGADVYAPVLPPYADTHTRALVLARTIDEILENTGAFKVHLIAHSQGGIDSRYLINALDYDLKVASLVTISTPHRGTPLADYVLNLPQGAIDPIAGVVAWLLGHVEDSESIRTPNDPSFFESASSMSTQEMALFNQRYSENKVPTYSIATVSNLQDASEICGNSFLLGTSNTDILNPLLLPTSTVLAFQDGLEITPNDGIVPTSSMVWGNFLGCVPADHFDGIGQLPTSYYSEFNHLEMYSRIYNMVRNL